MELLREEVIACHLRYGDVPYPLRQRAHAAIIEKGILYNTAHDWVSLKKIGAAIRKVLGGPRLSETDLREGLQLLVEVGAVERSG